MRAGYNYDGGESIFPSARLQRHALPFQLEAQRLYADFQNQAWLLISRIDQNAIRDPAIRRRLRYLSVVGPSALTPDQLDRVSVAPLPA